jgi:methyl-accepting chemotaxis protein
MDDIACAPGPVPRACVPTKASFIETASLHDNDAPAGADILAELERLSAAMSELAVAVGRMEIKVDNGDTNSADIVAVMQEVKQTPQKTVDEMQRL